MLRPAGQPHSWVTIDEMNALLRRAEMAGEGEITVPAKDLARLIKSHIICAHDLSDVRAACRREIIRVRNERPA